MWAQPCAKSKRSARIPACRKWFDSEYKVKIYCLSKAELNKLPEDVRVFHGAGIRSARRDLEYKHVSKWLDAHELVLAGAETQLELFMLWAIIDAQEEATCPG